MRFSVGDWLLLVLASAIASLAIAGLQLVAQTGLPAVLRPIMVHSTPVMTTLDVISALVKGLATWMVLRRCVENLRLGHWLLAVAGGTVLGTVLLLPAVALNMPLRANDLLSLSGDPVHLLARWLTVIAVSVATFLPPGLLLQRLTGASAWPFISLGALWTIFVRLAGPALVLWLARYAFYLAFLHVSSVGLATMWVAITLLWGMLYGLTIGAGLFLMARRSLRPVAAA